MTCHLTFPTNVATSPEVTVHACFVKNEKEKTAKANKAACVAGGVTGVWLATYTSAAVTAATGGAAVVAGAGYGIYRYVRKIMTQER